MSEQTSGLVIVDKPAGFTSHDVVARVRRLAGTRKVGPLGKVEAYARLEGRNMTMVLAPEKKVVKKEPAKERTSAPTADGTAADAAPTDAPASDPVAEAPAADPG